MVYFLIKASVTFIKSQITATQRVYFTLASGCSLVDLTQESVVAEINANFGDAATVQTFEGFDGDNQFAV